MQKYSPHLIGTIDLLDTIVLNHFDEAMQDQDLDKFKTTIIFTKTLLAIELQDHLVVKYRGIPEENRPWVVNFSDKDEIDKEDIATRTSAGH